VAGAIPLCDRTCRGQQSNRSRIQPDSSRKLFRMNRLILFPFLLTLLSGFVDNANDLERCNTMPNDALGIFPNHANTDYERMKIAYLKQSEPSEQRQRIYYVVRKPAIIHSVLAVDVVTNEILLNCTTEPSDLDNTCCIHNTDERGSYKPENCEFSAVVYNTGYQENESEYMVVYEYVNLARNFTNELILFTLRDGLAPTYFSTHEVRDVNVVCPQLATGGGHITSHPKLDDLLTSRAELHTIRYEDLHPAVRVEEYTNLTLEISGYARNSHIFQIWYIHDHRYGDRQTEGGQLQISKLQPELDSSYDTHLKEHLFSLRIQWDPNYKYAIRRWRQTITIGRDARALLLIIHGNVTQVDEFFLPVLQSWLSGSTSPEFEWPSTIQSPALRLFGLSVTRKALFNEGDSKIMHVSPDEMIHEPTERKVCDKRLQPTDDYTPSRMFMQPNKSYYEIHNLRIEDTGMYTCYAGDGRVIVFDQYVIVLPRPEDLVIILTDTVPKTQTNLSQLEDNYPYFDSDGRAMFHGEESIHACCGMILHRGIDNLDGLNATYEVENMNAVWNQTRQSTEKHGDYFHLITCYALYPLYAMTEVKSTFTCLYRYRPIDNLVRHSEEFTDRYAVEHVKSRQITASKYPEPRIFPETIYTSSLDLTKQLTSHSYLLPTLYGTESVHLGSSQIFEGLLISSFVALLDKNNGWGSVWMFQKSESTTTLVQTPCKFVSYEFVTKEESIPGSITLNKSYNLVRRQFDVECVLSRNVVALLYAAYIVHNAELNKTIVEKQIRDWIADHVLHVDSESASDRNVDARPPDFVTGSFRMSRVRVGWIGTVNVGSPIKMIWSDPHWTGTEMHCKYAMTADDSKTDLPGDFYSRPSIQYTYFELLKKEASERDSGLYYCCVKCDSETRDVVKRLVVLPDTAKFKMRINRTDSANETGSGSFEDPIRTHVQTLFAHCEYMVYRGVEATVKLDLAYETCAPGNEQEHVDLANKKVLKRNLSESVGEFNHLLVVYHLERPEPDEYWNYVRVSCILQLINVTRDPFDLVDTSVSKNEKLVKSIYFTYNLTRNPTILPDLIFSDSPNLQIALRRNAATRMEDVFNDTLCPVVKERENFYTVNYTVFLGLPRGRIRLWIVHYRTTVDKENTIILSPCSTHQVEPVVSAQQVVGLDTQTKYKVNRGINFEQHEYTCLLDISTFAMVIVGFGWTSTNLSLEERESHFREQIIRLFSLGRHMSAMNGQSIIEQNNVIFRLNRFAIGWTALVQPWRAVRMIGERFEKRPIQCFYKTDDEEYFLPAGPRILYIPVSESVKLLVEIQHAVFSDAGVYKCNVTQVCPDCPVRTGLAPRRLHVLPDQSLLTVHFNHDRLQMNEQSVHKFEQYTSTNEPFLFRNQSVSFRCLHQLSPVHRLRPRVHLIPELLDRKNKVLRNLKLHDPFQFTTKVNEVLTQTVTGVIIAPSPGDSSALLSVTCRLTYDFGVIPNDLSGRTGVVQLSNKTTFIIKISAPPNLFSVQLLYTNSSLLHNMVFATKHGVSATHFHASGSTGLLEESVVSIHSIQGLGVPLGRMHTWLVYMTDAGLDYDECKLVRRAVADDRNFSPEMEASKEFGECGGRNIFEASTHCVLQPRHLMLVFLLYNSIDDGDVEEANMTGWDTQLAQSLLVNARAWFSKPTSSELLQLASPNRARVAYALVKLSIGWQATVTVGKPWTILVRNHRSPNTRLLIYHRRSWKHERKLLRTLSGGSETFSFGENASYAHTGIYSCVVTNCDECRLKTCFHPRRLLVFPAPPLLQLYLNERILNPAEPMLDEFTKAAISSDEAIYVHCVYTRPFGISSNEKLLFSYHLQSHSSDFDEALPYTRLSASTTENQENGTIVMTPFLIRGPLVGKPQPTVRLQCELTFAEDDFDVSDTSRPERTKPIVSTRRLGTRLRLKPILFTRSVHTTNHQTTNWLRQSLVEVSRGNPPTDFGSSHELKEGIFEIGVVVSLGLPTGQIYATTFINNNGIVYEEPCKLSARTVIQPDWVSSHLEQEEEYDEFHDESLFFVRFACVVHKESFALGFLLLSPDEGVDPKTASADAHSTLSEWLSQCLNSSQAVAPASPRATLVSYKITGLNVFWNATVRIGSRITMIGHTESSQQLVFCSHQADTNAVELALGFQWQKIYDQTHPCFTLINQNVRPSDSGLYTCTRLVSLSYRQTIFKRPLLVLPDQSVLDIFLTYERLTKHDPWRENFTDYDGANRPFVYTGTSLFAHCLHETWAEQWLNVSGEFFLHTMNEQGDFFDPLPVNKTKIQVRSDSRVLRSSQIYLSLNRDYGHWLLAECEWRFMFTERMRRELGHYVSTQQPMRFRKSIRISVRFRIPPTIFPQYSKTADRPLATVISELHSPIQSAVQFHSERYVVRGPERVGSVRWLLSLGVPRAWVNAWTVYRFANHLYTENCLVYDVMNLTRADLPYELKSAHYGRDNELNYVSLQVSCVFHREHIAHIIMVQNYQEDLENKSQFREQVQRSLLSDVDLWLQQPNSMEQSVMPEQPGVYTDYRILRLSIDWPTAYKSGHPVNMLGYLHGLENPLIKCYYAPTNVFTPLVESQQFEITIVYARLAFFLTKLLVQFYDTGHYTCNVTESFGCSDCAPLIGFPPRPMIVQAQQNLIRLFLNQRSDYPPTRYFTQCTPSHLPYLKAGQKAFVFCSYSRQRDTLAWPDHSFRLLMINSQTNTSKPLPSTHIREIVLTTELHEKVIEVYGIEAPPKEDISGPLQVSCGLTYAYTNQRYFASRRIDLIIFTPPIIFVNLVSTSRAPITESIQRHLNSSPASGMKFENNGPRGYVLEGKLYVNYTVGLGRPRARSSIDLFFVRWGRLQRRQCSQDVLDDYSRTPIPHSIQISDYFREADGTSHPVRYNATCHLTTNVVAVLISVISTQNPRVSVEAQTVLFYHSVYTVIQHWFREPHSSVSSNYSPQTRGGAAIHYGLFRLNVGWRSSVRVGDPVILFGTQPVAEALERMECYHRHTKTSKPVRLDIDSGGAFRLFVEPPYRSVELIKQAAELSDSGNYECVSRRCEHCYVFPVVIQHELRVIPTVKLDIHVHFSEEFVAEHTDDHHLWTYTQYASPHLPFIYGTQTIAVVCDYHAPPWTRDIFDWGLEVKQTRKIDYYFGAQLLNYTELNRMVKREKVYSAMFKVFALTGPTGLEAGDKIVVDCRLGIGRTSPMQDDVNDEVFNRFYIHSRLLSLRVWITPVIIGQSILTESNFVTSELKSSHQPDGHQFLGQQFTERLSEGTFALRFSNVQGQPPGTSGAFGIYNESSGLTSYPCLQDLDYYQQANTLDMMGKLAPEDDERHRFVCLLLSEQIAIGIYTVHYRRSQRDVNYVDVVFRSHVVASVNQWLSGYNVDKPLGFPEGMQGDYSLIRVQVRWPNVVKTGQSIVMYGLLDVQVTHKPICYYGHKSARNEIPTSKGFLLETNMEWRYFRLYKTSVETTDSGYYKCSIPNAGGSGQFGFAPRRLIVLPDSSILHLTVESSQSNPNSSSMGCESQNVTRLSPGSELHVSCSHVVSKSDVVDAHHIITYGAVGDSGTKLLNLITAIEDGDSTDTIVVKSSGTLRLPIVVKPPFIWFFRCDLPFEITHVSHESAEDWSWAVSELHVERQFGVFDTKDPIVLGHRIEHSDGTAVNHTMYTKPNETILRWYDDQLTYRRLPEDSFKVVFTAYPGMPYGWTFVRSFYVHESTVLSDRCFSTWTLNRTNIQVVVHQCICPLQSEHVALLLAVASVDQAVLSKYKVEEHLEHAVLYKISHLLGYPADPPPVSTFCFRFDYHLIQLRIGWNATVDTGQRIVMYGLLAGRKSVNITCFYQRNESETPKRLDDRFELSVEVQLGRFRITKLDARPHDTGIYFCNRTDEPNKLEVGYFGLLPRRLHVLPTSAVVDCLLTLDLDAKECVSKTQQLEDGTLYLMSNTTAFVHCTFEKEFRQLYSATYHLLYQMGSSATESMKFLQDVIFVGETQNDTRVTHTYRIFSPSAKYYTGNLRVTCLNVFRNLRTPFDLHNRTDTFRINCSKSFTIREPAHGTLKFQTVGASLMDRMVPLGTEIVCTGGEGIPALNHSWYRVQPIRYGPRNLPEDIPSILPGDGGGWGGPERPFSDMPTTGLEVRGNLLKVPEDPLYRGMAYAYECVASNTVLGVKYNITKYLYLSVLICPSDAGTMDLSILLSRRLMAACRIVDNPNPDVQYYGYFWLTLVRQLVLGLPLGHGHTRISFIELVQGIGRDAKQYNFSTFKKVEQWYTVAYRLYSQKNKPVSGQSVCSSPPTDFGAIFRIAIKLYDSGFKTNPLFLLPVDYFTAIGNETELKILAKELRRAGVKVLLAFTHALDSRLKRFNEKITQLLKPWKAISIVPDFEGITDCTSCHLPLQTPYLRIRRAELFDAICEASGSRLPDRIPAPSLAYSIPTRYWYPGNTLRVRCIDPVLDISSPSYLLHGVICLANESALIQLGTILRPNVQQLRTACNQLLKSRTHSPCLVGSCTQPGHNAVSLILDERPINPFVLCYNRLGYKNAKLFDAVNFTQAKILAHSREIGTPDLRVTHWDRLNTRLVQFSCSFQGFAAGLETLLLFQPEHEPLSDSKPPYMIVSRRRVRMNLNSSLTVVPDLFWREIRSHNSSGQFICLVRPIETNRTPEASFSHFPNTTLWTKYSQPIPSVPANLACPSAPRMLIEPTENVTLQAGSSVRVECLGRSSPDVNSFKLFYLSPILSIIVCYRPQTTLPIRADRSCFLTSSSDDSCSVVLANQSIDHEFYHFECVSKVDQTDLVQNHWIRFEVSKLRSVDLSSTVFCQTVYAFGSETYEGRIIQSRLTSNVHRIRFLQKPDIVYFGFDVHKQLWNCRIIAYPMLSGAEISQITVSSRWLYKQLEAYTSHTDHKQPPVKDVQLLRKFDKLALHDQLEYTVSVTFSPIVPVSGGLTHGRVELRCKLGDIWESLITEIHKHEVRNEPALPSSHVSTPQSGMHVKCTLIKQHADDPVIGVILHRVQQSSWLSYDLALLTISIERGTAADHSYEHHKMKPDFGLLGPWTQMSHSVLRVLSDQTILKCSVFVSLPTASEFDTATYYCTGRTERGNFLISDDLVFVSLGANKRIAFGYRSEREPNVWRTTERSVMLNDRLLLRCVVWTTIPGDRLLNSVVLSLGDRHNRSRHHSGCVNETLSFGMVLCVEDHVEHVGSEASLGTFDCEVTDKAGQRKAVVPSPKVVCTTPPYVAVKVSTHNGTAVYECHSEHTCTNPRYSWEWMAGPIPQLYLYEDIPHSVNYSEDGLLYESRITRPGYYWFLCRVTCVCGSEPLTHSKVHLIEVPLREDGKRNYRLSNPIVGELAPEQLFDANSTWATTVDRFQHRDRLEAMALVNRTTVNERQTLHTQVEPDYRAEHIASDNLDVASQFEERFHRRSYLGSDIRGEASIGRQLAADATKRAMDRYEDYAFRRTSDSGTKLVVPEIMFRLYEPPEAQRKTRGEVESDSTSIHSPVARMSSNARETLKYSHRMDYTRDTLLSLGSLGLQNIVDLPSSMFTQPQVGRSRTNESSRSTTTVSVRHSRQSGDFTAHTHHGKIGRELSVDWRFDDEEPHRKHPDVHLDGEGCDVVHRERLPTRIPITPELVDTMHVSDPVTNKTVAIQGHSHLKSKRIGYHVMSNLVNAGKWNSRATYSATFDAGLRRDRLTKTSASCLSKLRDDNWLERYESGGMQTDLPWMFDSQTRQYVGAVDSAGLHRSCKPTGRVDLEMFNRDAHKLRGFRTEMPACGGSVLERGGVTSHVGTIPLFSMAETRSPTESDLRPAFTWSRHPVNTNRSMHESSFQSAEEHDVDFGNSIEAFLSSVFMKPGFIILPGLVTLVCPSWQPTFRSHEVAQSITWFRWSGVEAAKYEFVGEVYLQQRRVTYARGRAYGTRVRFSPPLKWFNSYTMDLTNAQPYDYGYYSCLITLTSPDQGNRKVMRMTKHPLCVASDSPKPQLWLANLPKTVAEQLRTSSSTKPLDEYFRERERNTSVCFKPGEEIVIVCQSEPYQVFCTGHDAPSNGSRLLHTLLQVHHYIPSHNSEDHKIALPDSRRWLPPLRSVHESDIFTSVRAWLLKTDTTQLGTTYLGCEAQPQLDRAVLSTLSYGNWLRGEFNVRRVQKLTRQSDRIQLCVYNANTSGDSIDVNPRLSSTGDGTLPTVTLGVYETLTCTWLGNKSMIPLNMSLYKISADQLSGFVGSEDKQAIRQIYDTRVPVTWPRKYEMGRTHMLIPREAVVGDTYLVICEAPEFRVTQVFTLHVQYPRKTVTVRKIGVALAWFACTLPAFGFLYLVIQQAIRRRRERQHAVRRMLIFREDSYNIFLEADSNSS
ncbi:hypothetical protein X801_05729, partial [Opisthorchis viverrini]